MLLDAAGTDVGTVTFDGTADSTSVTVDLHDLATELSTFHGIHIHANDEAGTCDPTADPPFSDVGGHYNPTDEGHGHHVGDLPPVYVLADGTASEQSVVQAMDGDDLDGRAVVLHVGSDNLANIPDRYVTEGSEPGPGPDAKTLDTGDGGDRFACGLITVE